ncbi:Acyl-coenzyme A thioesterase PaaI, contains HGG motif [Mycolicibacterium rutilum]|uniref:Acyl-coenzyme A thioesterase THEM4 n=1 Tax=Mycolicibacterium rutilum TaxID=370526 RepID=A0A1H6KTW6_MYCRU|nr:PaaI family thioesterase [Mycolicibacterium rutilum]SEH75114.1 Acyl-coenzyme A thioesterase PaaI, contains HGG motif [Mycolicibacterium rutilum]
MSMDFGFDMITEDEYQRQRALYEPLTEAVRRLIYASLHTDVGADAAAEARTKIEAVTALLETEQRASVPLVHENTGRPLAWANPAVGLRNAIAPPMVIHHEDDGSCWSEFTLSGAYEGPPGWVHGGICALVLDHLLGEAASEGLTQPKFTGTISLRYLRGTPLGPLRAEAFVERTEGVKTFARGYLKDADGATVEAEGVFIRPAWARDAG